MHDVWLARDRAAEAGRQAWALNEQESEPFLRQALDLGINFGIQPMCTRGDSERVVGNFLKAHTRREAIVIATKAQGLMREEPNGRGLSRKAILFELDESLKRLQTDYVDLYRFTAGTMRRRLRRPWRRCTTR